MIAANVVVFGAFSAARYWGERDRSLPEFNADKIRLLEQPPHKGRTPAAAAPAPTPAPEVVASAGAAALCYRIEGMAPGRYQAFREMSARLASAAGAGFTLMSDNPLPWWVYWPPEYEAAQRAAVVRKLTAAGVKDYLAIARGAMAQSYALGLFPSEAQARAQRDTLRQKGLDKAEYGVRPGIGPFMLRFAPDSAARVETLKDVMPAWAVKVDCPA